MTPCLPAATLSRLRATAEGRPVWVVDLPRQRLICCGDSPDPEVYPVSTATAGTGNRPDSYRTPIGWHAVAEIIGGGAPLGQPFVSRKPAGPPLTDFASGDTDAILTRILVLDGLEPALNRNSRARCIYLHGTNREDLLGTPASKGCIRMRNQDIARLADACLQRPREQWPRIWTGCCISDPVR